MTNGGLKIEVDLEVGINFHLARRGREQGIPPINLDDKSRIQGMANQRISPLWDIYDAPRHADAKMASSLSLPTTSYTYRKSTCESRLEKPLEISRLPFSTYRYGVHLAHSRLRRTNMDPIFPLGLSVCSWRTTVKWTTWSVSTTCSSGVSRVFLGMNVNGDIFCPMEIPSLHD